MDAYEKKFMDFLDKMQGLLDNAKKQGHIIIRVEDLENALSEFVESEDEKIRKALIRQFNSLNTIVKWGGIEREKIIAWLEKQKPLNRNVNTIPFLSHYEPKCYQPNGTCTNPLHDCLECPKFSLYRGTYTSTL